MSWFKYSFCNSVYSMFSEFCSAANIRSHISVKMENKMKKSLSPMYSLKLKNIILFLTQTLIFILFKWSYSKPCFNVSQLVKIYVENGKVISTLSNFVQINVEIDNFDLMLFKVDVQNVVSTFIQLCVTSRCHVNLKQPWNVLKCLLGNVSVKTSKWPTKIFLFPIATKADIGRYCQI